MLLKAMAIISATRPLKAAFVAGGLAAISVRQRMVLHAAAPLILAAIVRRERTSEATRESELTDTASRK